MHDVMTTEGTTSDDGLRRALAAFSQVAVAAIDNTASLDDLLHVVAREISLLVDAKRCSIHLRDDAGGMFRGCVGRCGDASLDHEIKRSLAGGPADGMTNELLQTRRPVIVPDARQDPRMVKSTVRFWGIRSIMAVPMIINDDDVVGVIFLDDVDRVRHFSQDEAEVAMAFGGLAAVAVVTAKAQVELRAQVQTAARQLNSLRRATAVDERLSDLVLEGRSLRDLLQTLAELLGKPCAVFSPAGERLATAVPDCTPDGIVPRLLEPEVVNTPDVREALDAHAGSRAFVVGPLPRAGVLHRHVVAPVLLGDEVWGRLVVMEHKRRFTGGDLVAVRRAATLVALQVNTERRAAEADLDAGSSLASELLSGASGEAVVLRRAERLGVPLDLPRIVMLVGPRSGCERDVPSFRAMAATFRRVAPELSIHATGVPGAAAALIDVPAGMEAEDLLAQARQAADAVRRTLDPAGGLVAAISEVHAGLEGYRAAHQEARQVLECIRRFSPPAGGPAVLAASELGVGRLFLATSDADLVRDFTEETFGVLVRDPSKTDLLMTLCSFFDNMASIRRSAASLDVHENTIRYRLSRVEELIGLAVTHDPDAQLRARLSLLVLLLEGRLPVEVDGPQPASRPALTIVQAAAV